MMVGKGTWKQFMAKYKDAGFFSGGYPGPRAAGRMTLIAMGKS